MSLVIDTFEDLVHIVETHPEWRRRLKRALFDIDLEASLERLSVEMEKLATTQNRQADDIEVLKDDVSVLKSDVSVLKSDVSVLKSDVSVLKSDVSVLKGDVATLKGKSYEVDYRLKAAGIFGKFIRRGRDRTDDIAIQLYDAVDAGKISEKDLDQVLAADLLWGGKMHKDGVDITLVLEASWRAEIHDVERALQRAIVLRQIGLPSIPVVAGMEWDERALALAANEGVATATEGRVDTESWQKALSLLF